jgi:hypothetical protein
MKDNIESYLEITSLKLFSTEKLYDILNILEQQYNIEIINPS